jgi:hypothetical protein
VGLYFGGVYFGEYAPAVAAAAPAAVVSPRGFTAPAWPGQAQHLQRRGWRWHRVRYTVFRAGEVVGRRRTFAGALELGLWRGVDLIEKCDLAHPGRVVRRWVGPELARVLERFGRRFR